MAISPSVQKYISQDQKGSTQAELSFNKKFGDQAYNVLNSKFPELINYVITFKTVESNIDESFALGAFIITSGKDVVYLPTILVGGKIESLETIYDKNEDTLKPLIKKYVNEIVEANSMQGPSLIKKPSIIENTKGMFNKMYRPPVSSKPVFASSADTFSEIPKEAKESLYNTFVNNPSLLSKVASFYDVEALSEKLKDDKTLHNLEKEAESYNYIKNNTAIDLDSWKQLSEADKEYIDTNDREKLAAEGMVVVEVERSPNKIISNKQLPVELVTKFNVQELTVDDRTLGTGLAPRLVGTEIVFDEVLIMADKVITKDGRIYHCHKRDTIVVSNFDEDVSRSTFKDFGFKTPDEVLSDIKSSTKEGKMSRKNLISAVPSKKGFKTYIRSVFLAKPEHSVNMDGVIYLGNAPKLIYTGAISKGIIDQSFRGENKDGYTIGPKNIDDVILPKDSLVLSRDYSYDNPVYFKTIQKLYNVLRKSSINLKAIQSGKDYILRDSTNGSSKTFEKKAHLADYVLKEYKVDKDSVNTLLNEKEGLFINKEAFVQNPAQADAMQQEQPINSMYTTNAGQQQAFPVPEQGTDQPQDYEVNEDLLNATANVGEKDLMDTGMLASLAGNDNIKSLLVDMFPVFDETTTELGRTILLFVMNKDDLTETYGREQYNTVLTNVRKIFRMLGELVIDLKFYTNLQ